MTYTISKDTVGEFIHGIFCVVLSEAPAPSSVFFISVAIAARKAILHCADYYICKKYKDGTAGKLQTEGAVLITADLMTTLVTLVIGVAAKVFSTPIVVLLGLYRTYQIINEYQGIDNFDDQTTAMKARLGLA